MKAMNKLIFPSSRHITGYDTQGRQVHAIQPSYNAQVSHIRTNDLQKVKGLPLPPPPPFPLALLPGCGHFAPKPTSTVLQANTNHTSALQFLQTCSPQLTHMYDASLIYTHVLYTEFHTLHMYVRMDTRTYVHTCSHVSGMHARHVL